ncbi:MAG: hypothetical protein HY584_00810, partial [Candidatus Omnitrophica bacterium]|nr:hypothetical protein [Candidatus Omnitrophota bacterium]
TKDDLFGLIVGQWMTVHAVILNSLLTHLVLIVLRKDKSKANFLIVNYGIALVLGVIIMSTKLFIQGTPPKLDFPAYSDGGPLYPLVPVYLFSNVFYDIYLVCQGMQKTEGHRKNQLALFLLAFGIGYLGGTPGILLVLDIPFKPVTTPLVILYPTLLTFAIVKHRFLDIRKLVKNTLTFSLLFIALLASVSLILFVLKDWMSRWIGTSESIAQGISIALAIACYGPLKKGLSKVTDHLLYQDVQDPGLVFRKLSKDMIHSRDVRSLASLITQRIRDTLALDRIGFYVRMGPNPQFFELAASHGRVRKRPIHKSKPLVLYLEQTKDHLISDLSPRKTRVYLKRKSFFALTSLKEIKDHATAEVTKLGGVGAFPVFTGERLAAILLVGRKKSDAVWEESDFKILNSFTRHLSLALRNALYLEKIRLSREELSKRERNQAAGALISGVNHEARNPLQVMLLTLETLHSKLHDPSFLSLPQDRILEDVRKTMTTVSEEDERVNNIIEHLSSLAQRKPLRIHEGVRPLEVAQRVLSELRRTEGFQKIKFRLDVERSLTVPCDEDALSEIFVNLIRNAGQAIGDQGEIILRAFKESEEILIQVQDNGQGIPPKLIPKIFNPFFTTKRKQGAAGTGMGLFIVKEYMQAMGGRVEAESLEGKGACFTLHFPTLEPLLREVA